MIGAPAISMGVFLCRGTERMWDGRRCGPGYHLHITDFLQRRIPSCRHNISVRIRWMKWCRVFRRFDGWSGSGKEVKACSVGNRGALVVVHVDGINDSILVGALSGRRQYRPARAPSR
jgi:hypothetical protein